MKTIVLKTYGKIIAWILTVLGLYTSCDIIEPRVEYGSPSADFVVMGKVIDEKTKQSINNIAVINKSSWSPYGNDTVISDENGNYVLKFRSTDLGAKKLTVYASDIDGEKNGSYLSDTIQIKSEELKQVEKENNWYYGKFEGKANFELKKDTQTLE